MKLTIPQSEFNWIPTSVSARNTYTQCPRKWWLQYRTDTPKNEGNMNARNIGSWVHKCLEMFYSKENVDKVQQWVEQPATLVAEAILHVAKEEENRGKVFSWEYSTNEEAIVFTCFLNLKGAIEKLGVEILLTENKVTIGNWFNGVIDVVCKTYCGNYIIIDYKNQANFEELEANVHDAQVRIYEAVFPELLKEAGLPELPLLGVAKLVAVKPKLKFRAKGKANETFEEYRERANASVQFCFIKKDDKVAEEHRKVHAKINEKLNTMTSEDDFPCNRANCIGKYGPCDFFDHCNPPTTGKEGFSLIDSELSLAKKMLAELSKQEVKQVEIVAEISADDFE